MRSMETARRLSRETGVTIESAMLTDIPGFTWGLVPVLAQNGVKYLSIGPNFGHRIGYLSRELGDKPFYWESPSGKERVLTWVSGAGYAWFHTGLGFTNLTNLLDELNVFKYLDSLQQTDYQYDITHMRYNIGADNGPPDPALANTVHAWNERYVSPRLIISSTTKLFEEFESRYGPQLPVFRGDMTGHWEDGVASSAKETALIRRVAESLVQIEALSAMLDHPLSTDELYQAWKFVLLYYEHTWGSWNSVSEPESEFTIRQWEQKREFARQAATKADDLRIAVLSGRWSEGSSTVEVLNTLSWPRNDVILLPADQSAAGDRVLDEFGIQVRSQRLSSGELAFLAEEVPALGSRRYSIETGTVEGQREPDTDSVVSTNSFSVVLNRATGTIASLEFLPANWDLVDTDSGNGLNEYLYVSSRNPEDVSSNGPAQVAMKDAGPLVWIYETRASAPGTGGGISSEIRFYDGLERVDIVNSLDKTLTYTPEAVLYRFPFNIPNPEIRIDVPWGSFRPEQDQIPGSSKNYMSVGNWVDIHNSEVGVTFVSVDVPMVQFGEVRTDPIVTGWKEHLEPSATLFSYVMNNYWETNYRAGQEGFHEFRYSLLPHAKFNESEADRFAAGIAQPLLVVPVDPTTTHSTFPMRVEAAASIVTSLAFASDGDSYRVRLFNPSGFDDEVMLHPRGEREWAIYLSDMAEERIERSTAPITLAPYEIVTLLIEVLR